LTSNKAYAILKRMKTLCKPIILKVFFTSSLLLNLLLLAAYLQTTFLNQSLGTATPDPIHITTWHSTYNPTDDIVATVYNQTNAPISANDHKAGCNIFDLQVKRNGTWEYSDASTCSLLTPSLVIAIYPNTTYTSIISASAHANGWQKGAFPPGTYRFELTYNTAGDNNVSTYSQPFAVKRCLLLNLFCY
jgi:hypothetical protein